MRRYQLILIGLILLLIVSRIYTQSKSTVILTSFINSETSIESVELNQSEQQFQVGRESELNDRDTKNIREDVTDTLPYDELKSYYAYMRDGTKVSIERFNQLSIDELKDFSGIGDVTATAIVNYRNELGGFSYYEELINVKGIGQKKLDKLLNPSFD